MQALPPKVPYGTQVFLCRLYATVYDLVCYIVLALRARENTSLRPDSPSLSSHQGGARAPKVKKRATVHPQISSPNITRPHKRGSECATFSFRARLCHRFKMLICKGHPSARVQSCGDRRAQPSLWPQTLHSAKASKEALREVRDKDWKGCRGTRMAAGFACSG